MLYGVASSLLQPASPSSKNNLALVSLVAGISWPMLLGLTVAGALAHVSTSARIVLVLIGLVGLAAPVAVVIAIVMGHIALSQAKRYAPGNARRGFAIAGMVLGYLGVALAIAVFVIATISTMLLQR